MGNHSGQSQPANSKTAWSLRRPKRAAVVYGAAYILVAALGGYAVALLAGPLAIAAAATLVAAVVLGLSLLMVLSICRVDLGPVGELALVLGLSILFAMLRPSVFVFLGRWLGRPEAGAHIAETLSFVPGQLVLGNTILIVWAAFLGKLVSRVIREGKLLLPVAVVASLADVITVFWGVVKHVSETAPELAETFSAAAPVELPEGVQAPILAFVGIGDFLFLAVFVGVAVRFSMRPVKTLWASYAAMLVAPLGFLFVREGPGLPGLPFIAAAALWANWRYLKFSREEKRALVVAGLLVLGVAAAIWLAFHR